MNNSIKMKKKNEDGVEITKPIPKELYSFYKNMGWEDVKEAKKETKPLTRDNLRVDKDKENENI